MVAVLVVLVVLVELEVSVRPDEEVALVDDVVEVGSTVAVPSVGALVWLADSLLGFVSVALLVLPEDEDSVVATLSPQATASETHNQQWRAIRSRLA